MGGFHGGHSGGHSGGFHGGSHSSYHHSSSSSYSPRPVVVHTVRGGHHYLNGKRYYGAYYGLSNGKPQTLGGILAIGFFCLLLGFILFAALFRVPRNATVTRVNKTGSYYDQYEVYDFDYSYGGVTYHGYGDDDLNSDGSFSIKEGETYTVYVNPFNPSSYSFDNTATFGILAIIFLGGVGIIIIVRAFKIYRHHQKELEAVGDINGDGVIDDKDLEYADSINKGQADGAYEGVRKAEAENQYRANKIIRRCPYCDSIVDDDAKFCSNCGSNLK